MYRYKCSIVVSLLAVVTSGLFGLSVARATNGYFSEGYGAVSLGMAGAGVAFPQDAMASTLNPAGMVFVNSRFDAGVALFNPSRNYNVTGAPSGAPGSFPLAPGRVTSKRDYFLVPDMAVNWKQGRDSAIGIALYGNGGMDTTYPTNAGGNGTFHGGQAGVDLEQLFLSPTYAHRFARRASWGVSAIFAYQTFEARGLSQFSAFDTQDSLANLTNNGQDHSTGYGVRVGVMAQVDRHLTLGLSHQSRISMGRFVKYSNLFAEGGSFDIPATTTGGLAWTPDKRSTVLLDVQYIQYHDISAVGNPFSNLLSGAANQNPTQLLGGQNGPGFGWNSMTIYKLGYQFQVDPSLALRVGASYGEQPIPSSEVLFNILAPGVEEIHYTAGLTKKIGRHQITLAVVYAPEKTVKGPNPLDPTQTIALQMDQLEIELGYGLKF